jgi:hypothetical protein
MATITSSSLAPWKQQEINLKNQLLGGLVNSFGGGVPRYSNYNGALYDNSTGSVIGGAVPPDRLAYMNQNANSSAATTGSMANAGNFSTSWGSDLYNTGAQRLTDTYNKAVQANINDANRRGLFGSSIAAQASQDTAKAYGQGLAELAANIGAQEAQYGLTQQQINNQRLNTLLGLFD